MEDLSYENDRVLGDVVPLEQPDVEDEVSIRISFDRALEKLSPEDREVICLLACGNKLKDLRKIIPDTRRRISRAKRNFRIYLERYGVELD